MLCKKVYSLMQGYWRWLINFICAKYKVVSIAWASIQGQIETFSANSDIFIFFDKHGKDLLQS